MFFFYSHSTDRRRYWNDYKLERSDTIREQKYKPKRCTNFNLRRCRTSDPVSGVKIPMLYVTDSVYICQVCKERETISKWFRRLQDTEIPSSLPQFRRLKGRLVYDIKDRKKNWGFGPPNDDPCWQYYSILEEYEQ